MRLFDDTAALNLGRIIGQIVVEATEKSLFEFGKVVTRKTIDSLRFEVELNDSELIIKLIARDSFLFIMTGRRPGGKLPVENVGGQWRLKPDLEAWKKAVGYLGADYVLAKSIADKGIPPTPVLSRVQEIIEAPIKNAITAFVGKEISKNIATELKTIYKKSN